MRDRLRRSVRSRSSGTSTKPATATLPAGSDAPPGWISMWQWRSPRRRRQKRPPWERDRASPRDECDHAAECGETQSGPPRRLTVGGEIESNAKAEGDRQPQQQSSGASVGRSPSCGIARRHVRSPKGCPSRFPPKSAHGGAALRRPTSRSGHGSRRYPCPNPPCARVLTRACRNALAPIRTVYRRPPWRMYHANRRCG